MPAKGDLTDELIKSKFWTDEMVRQAGIPVVEVPLVTVGGGLGSFALVDFLRIAGVPGQQIKVLTNIDQPYETYRYLAQLSQIRDSDRLRSDSMTQMDNIWGFPSYALREAWEKKSLAPLWNVVTEPILTDFYNPSGEQMYKGIDREIKRIGWLHMLVKGQVRMVRRRFADGYFTILTPPPGRLPTQRVAFRSTHVHIAVGYPSLRFLPDLQEYRSRYNDFVHVVNAYESHDHVYENLRQVGGTVVIRGAGIVASRLLERLIEGQDESGKRVQIIHLFRTYVAGPKGRLTWRRPAADGWSYQAFTFPKAAGGGQLRMATLKLEGDERANFIRSMGGTTTAKRKTWQEQLRRGRREGWYRVQVGEVQAVEPKEGRVLTRIKTRDGGVAELVADYIIDATGLEGDIKDSRLLADLLEYTGAGKNSYGRLDVDRNFVVRGSENGGGRIFASGTIAMGGYLAPVDSFWGVQHAALAITDELAKLAFCGKITRRRSVSQWVRWMANQRI